MLPHESCLPTQTWQRIGELNCLLKERMSCYCCRCLKYKNLYGMSAKFKLMHFIPNNLLYVN